MFDVLRNRSFRSLVAGRLVTNAGDSLYSVAAMWLVWELTGSPAMTGVAGFLTQLPGALQLFAGPLVDRWSLRRVLVGTQLIQAVLVLAVPLAWYLDALTVWVVLTVMPLLSLCNQFVYPAQAALVPRLVEKAQLVQANSALAFAYQGTDLVFNALAGVLVAAVGAVALYLVDSVTFIVAALLFLSIRIPDAAPDDAGDSGAGVEAALTDGGDDEEGVDEKAKAEATDGEEADEDGLSAYLADLREGVAYVRGTLLLPLLLGGVVANFAIAATMPVLPAFGDALSTTRFDGATVYGALLAAVAGGSLLGSAVASAFRGQPYGRLSIVAFTLSGACWLGAVLAPGVVLSVLLFGLAAVPIGVTNVVAAAMIQSLVPNVLMGRISSVATSVSVGLTPAGALTGGIVAEQFGVPVAVAMGGVGLLSIAVYVLVQPRLRRLGPVDEVDTLAW
jgi:MFS family permease